MKSTTYARLALFFPYLILTESILYFVHHKLDTNKSNVIENFNFWWNFLAIFWFIPYTIVTICLLIWSKRKTPEQIRSTYTQAPLIMMLVSPIAYLVIFIIGLISSTIGSTPVDAILGVGKLLLVAAVISVPASLFLGYIFVGICLLLYKLLQKIYLIRD